MSQPRPQVTVVLPAVSDSKVSNDLRYLTEALITGNHVTEDDCGGGILGGEYGYGAHFENDVFEMHPYYWGDCECGFEEADYAWSKTHDHETTCYQKVIRARGFIDFGTETTLTSEEVRTRNHAITDQACAEMGLDPEYGSYVHCTCRYNSDYRVWRAENTHAPTCGIVVPNFRHKASGTTVSFYKYIGRGMEIDLRGDWVSLFAECVASLSE